MLERLLALCDTNTDQQIDYMEFVNFLNWKDQMPTGLPHGDQATDYDRKIMESIRSTNENQVGDDGSIDPSVLQHQTDIANYFQTSSSLYGKGNLDKCKLYFDKIFCGFSIFLYCSKFGEYT